MGRWGGECGGGEVNFSVEEQLAAVAVQTLCQGLQ